MALQFCDQYRGFLTNPQDVALDTVHNTAYVTTRDDPGTTGALWRVDLTTGIRTLVTFNLGAPHQIALDVAASLMYWADRPTGTIKTAPMSREPTLRNLISNQQSPFGVAIGPAAGKVYWLQPVCVNGAGARLYGTATPAVPGELAPLERRPALVTRRSPLTIVRDVARAILAAPVVHYYSLVEVARVYHHPKLPDAVARFSLHPLFEDPARLPRSRPGQASSAQP